jgi:muramidase (phage lysozyme)
MTRIEKAAPILAMIRGPESEGAVKVQGVASAYDVVYGGIPKEHRTKNPLTTYPISEVIAWQRFAVAQGADSSAAGAYQIIRTTLMGLDAPGDPIFDKACQDGLALQLLDMRGWDDCEAGKMSSVDFADMLSREWASLPVQRNQRGRHRPVVRGHSYYDGDGLNRSHVTPEAVLAAVEMALHGVAVTPEPKPEPAPDLVALRFAAIEAEYTALREEAAALADRMSRVEAFDAAFSAAVKKALRKGAPA